jgi:hypothetical protein
MLLAIQFVSVFHYVASLPVVFDIISEKPNAGTLPNLKTNVTATLPTGLTPSNVNPAGQQAPASVGDGNYRNPSSANLNGVFVVVPAVTGQISAPNNNPTVNSERGVARSIANQRVNVTTIGSNLASAQSGSNGVNIGKPLTSKPITIGETTSVRPNQGSTVRIQGENLPIETPNLTLGSGSNPNAVNIGKPPIIKPLYTFGETTPVGPNAGSAQSGLSGVTNKPIAAGANGENYTPAASAAITVSNGAPRGLGNLSGVIPGINISGLGDTGNPTAATGTNTGNPAAAVITTSESAASGIAGFLSDILKPQPPVVVQ